MNLVINELKLQWIEMRQYWFETITSLGFLLVMFLGVFFGIKGFVLEQGDNQTLDSLIFGFLLWTFASAAYGSITRSVIEDTQKGYIEQLFMCPKGFVVLMLSRSLADIIPGLITITLMAYLVMFITGNWLNINFLAMYAILLLSAPSLVGFALTLCGLTLVYKKIETVSAVLSLLLMGLVAIDGLPFNAFSLLPFASGATMAKNIALLNEPFIITHLLIVCANSLVYLGSGILIFRFFERKAKRLNLIGQY